MLRQPVKSISLSGSTIKIMAIAAMFIDHFAAVFLSRLIQSGMAENVNPMLERIYIYMRSIGRIAFPLFVFLLIEGVLHTRSRLKYLGRMALFAVISEIPFDLAFNINMYHVRRGRILEFSYQNVFFTLSIGLLVVIILEFLWKKPLFLSCMAKNAGEKPDAKAVAANAADRAVKYVLSTLAAAAGAALSFFMQTDYAGIGVVAVVMMYAMKRRRCAGVMSVSLVLSVYSLAELPAILSVIPVYFYNGNRGRSAKWLFYIFYPAHLLALWLVCRLLGIIS